MARPTDGRGSIILWTVETKRQEVVGLAFSFNWLVAWLAGALVWLHRSSVWLCTWIRKTTMLNQHGYGFITSFLVD